MTSFAETGGVVLVALAGFRLAEFIIGRYMSRGSSRYRAQSLSKDHAQQLDDIQHGMTEMITWHSKTDEDGIPLGYIPRRWGKHLEQIEALMRELVSEARRRNGRG